MSHANVEQNRMFPQVNISHITVGIKQDNRSFYLRHRCVNECGRALELTDEI